MNVKLIEFIRNLIVATDENRVSWDESDGVYSVTTRGVDVSISQQDHDIGVYSISIKFKDHDMKMDLAYGIIVVLFMAAQQNVYCRRLL